MSPWTQSRPEDPGKLTHDGMRHPLQGALAAVAGEPAVLTPDVSTLPSAGCEPLKIQSAAREHVWFVRDLRERSTRSPAHLVGFSVAGGQHLAEEVDFEAIRNWLERFGR